MQWEKHESMQVNELAKLLKKKDSYISTILAQLKNYGLVGHKKEWRNHYYYPAIDALIAFSE